MYLAPQSIPCATVLTLGNKVVLLYWSGLFIRAVVIFELFCCYCYRGVVVVFTAVFVVLHAGKGNLLAVLVYSV